MPTSASVSIRLRRKKRKLTKKEMNKEETNYFKAQINFCPLLPASENGIKRQLKVPGASTHETDELLLPLLACEQVSGEGGFLSHWWQCPQ